MQIRTTALRVSAWYAVCASAYIVVTGHVAKALATSTEAFRSIEVSKGLLFVLLTSTLLFCLLDRAGRQLEAQAHAAAATALAAERAGAQANVGRLAAGAAHDFSNLLAVVGGTVHLLAVDQDRAPEERLLLDRLQLAVQRGSAIARRLAAADAKSLDSERGIHDVGRLVTEAIDLARMHPRAKACDLQTGIEAGIEAHVAPGVLHQAVLNLLINACDAACGRVWVNVSRVGANAHIEVHDDGPGVPPHIADGLFREARTTKPDGTGLGLLSVKACAEVHNGSASFDRSPLGGAMFELRIPALAKVREAS